MVSGARTRIMAMSHLNTTIQMYRRLLYPRRVTSTRRTFSNESKNIRLMSWIYPTRLRYSHHWTLPSQYMVCRSPLAHTTILRLSITSGSTQVWNLPVSRLRKSRNTSANKVEKRTNGRAFDRVAARFSVEEKTFTRISRHISEIDSTSAKDVANVLLDSMT
jgi:hypothetical protein